MVLANGINFWGIDIIITFISMVIGLVIVPYTFMKKTLSIDHKDIGIKKITLKESLIILLSLIVMYAYVLFYNYNLNRYFISEELINLIKIAI